MAGNTRVVILQLKDRIVFPCSVVSFLASISVQPFACAKPVSEKREEQQKLYFQIISFTSSSCFPFGLAMTLKISNHNLCLVFFQIVHVLNLQGPVL
jgi:hypothetical protein